MTTRISNFAHSLHVVVAPVCRVRFSEFACASASLRSLRVSVQKKERQTNLRSLRLFQLTYFNIPE